MMKLGRYTPPASSSERQAPAGTAHASIDTVTPSGRDLSAMSMESGRMFGGQDTAASCRVALVNQVAAAQYFDGTAVGRSLRDASGRRIDVAEGATSRPRQNPWTQKPLGFRARGSTGSNLASPLTHTAI